MIDTSAQFAYLHIIPKYLKINSIPMINLVLEDFCLDYPFWSTPLIHGFTSILSAICGKTRYCFTLPTCNKTPNSCYHFPVHSNPCHQEFPVLYIQTDNKGGEMGHTTDFLKRLTVHKCIYLGTGCTGSSLNSKVECPNCNITNGVRGKSLKSGLSDEF